MMHQQWTVCCDSAPYPAGLPIEKQRACCASDQVSGTKRKCQAEFIAAGWQRKARGRWLCPDCAKENRNT